MKKLVIYAQASVNIKISIFNLRLLSHFCMDFYATKTSRTSDKKTFLMIYNYIFVGYKVSEILVKIWHLLTLIIYGMEVLLYKKKTYPAVHISLYWLYMACGGL